MNEKMKRGIIIALVAGFVTILFGGWAVAMAGAFAGIGLGLFLGGKTQSTKPMDAFKADIVPILVSAAILLVISLCDDLFIANAIGKTPNDINNMIGANLVGLFAFIAFAGIMVATHTLPEKRQRIAMIVILTFVIIAFPFFDSFTGLRWTSQVIFALIFTILALGLNIVVGFAGLLDLGYAAFFAIGAYTTGILSSPQHGIFLNFWLVIWIAAAVAGIFGIILGAPTLPLRGDYLAIVTLGFGEIVPVLFKNLIKVTIQEPFTCWIIPAITKLFGASSTLACITFMKDVDLTAGEKGINPIGRPSLPIIALDETMGLGLVVKIAIMLIFMAVVVFMYRRARSQGNRSRGLLFGFIAVLVAIAIVFIPIPHPDGGVIGTFFNIIQPGEFQSDNSTPWYFLVIAIILMSIFIIQRLRDSRTGRAWMAVREDELAASQMGIDPVRTKLLAFAMGAMFSGFAGAFYGAYIRAIFPSVFDFSVSIIVLCMVILGGLGNINGVIVGGLVIMSADRLFLPALKDFLAGLLKTTILPSLAGNPTLRAAVEQNANPILYRFLLFGLTLVIMMAVRPQGLIPSAQRKAELVGDENESTEPLTAPEA